MTQENVVTIDEFINFARENENVLKLTADFLIDNQEFIEPWDDNDVKKAIERILDNSITEFIYNAGKWKFEIGLKLDGIGDDDLWEFISKIINELMKKEGVNNILMIK